MPPPLPEGNGLTPEERERLRRVFSEVWTKPEVAAAREAVHQATVKYRDTVKAAVEKLDPAVAPLLEKMHRNITSSAGKHRMGPGLGGKRPGGPLPRLPQNPNEALERILEHEPGFDVLAPPDRKRILELAQEVAKEKEVQDLLTSAIRTTEPPSEAFQARRKVREKLLHAMAAKDPWVEQVLRRPPAKDKDKDKDKDKGPAEGAARSGGRS